MTVNVYVTTTDEDRFDALETTLAAITSQLENLMSDAQNLNASVDAVASTLTTVLDRLADVHTDLIAAIADDADDATRDEAVRAAITRLDGLRNEANAALSAYPDLTPDTPADPTPVDPAPVDPAPVDPAVPAPADDGTVTPDDNPPV